MPRIRTIKPEFPHSESMGRVSRDARLTFVELWTLVDDSGRARGNSRMLASLLFPYDSDAPELIGSWLEELEREGCIIRYRAGANGSEYVAVTEWNEHQRIDKPSKSKFPPPPEPDSENVRESSRAFVEPSEKLLVGPGPGSEDQDQEGTRTGKGPGSEEGCSEPAAPPSDPSPDGTSEGPPEFPEFPTVGRKSGPRRWSLTEPVIRRLQEAYPGVDVVPECRKAFAWTMANPTKRKTANGMEAFLNRWCEKAQNSGPSARAGPKTFAQQRVENSSRAIKEFSSGR